MCCLIQTYCEVTNVAQMSLVIFLQLFKRFCANSVNFPERKLRTILASKTEVVLPRKLRTMMTTPRQYTIVNEC